MTDFDRAILLIRHPLNSLMSFFNDIFTKDKTTYASLEEYERRFKQDDVLSKGIQQWLKFHDVILEHYQSPLLVIQYEELKSNFVGEMEKILPFLGLDMTPEIASCLLEESVGHFKRKSRPQKETDEIYKNFTTTQIEALNNTYKKYLKKFQNKVIDLQIRQSLQKKYNKHNLT